MTREEKIDLIAEAMQKAYWGKKKLSYLHRLRIRTYAVAAFETGLAALPTAA